MSASSWRTAAVLPLLLELTRALRARRFYLPDDPAQASVLQRSAQIWTAALARGVALRLRTCEGGFELGTGERIGGAGVRDLARALRDAGVHHLVILPELQSVEFLRFVEVLASSADAAVPPQSPQGLARALADAGVRHVCIGEVEPAIPGRAPTPPAVVSSVEIEGEHCDERAVDRLLASLERSIDGAAYRRVWEDLEVQLQACMADKDFVDAYRTALVLGRHCAGVGPKLPEVQACASQALHRLVMDNAELLRIAVQRAYTPATASAVEAIQLLVALGSDVVPRLLEEHTRGSPEAQEQTPFILVAMADAALPVLVQELAAATPARVRRAARLLGEMQHPRADAALQNLLRTSEDEPVQREAARALARIGTPGALAALIEALREKRGTRACAAAYALGWSGDGAGLEALCAVVREPLRSHEVSLQAVASLGRLGGAEAVEALADGLESARGWNRKRVRAFRLAAVEALGRMSGHRARSLLERYAREGDAQVREACTKALASEA